MGGGFPIKAFGNDTCPHGGGETCPHGSGEWAVHNVFTECLRILRHSMLSDRLISGFSSSR